MIRTGFILVMLFAWARLSCAAAPATPQDLNRVAVEESLTPIRPGAADKQPFWNGQAKQFIFAPAFDFKSVAGAKSYRFTVKSDDGRTRTFEAPEPWAPLSPVWTDVPVGTATLTVEALNKSGGGVISVAGTRQFHRAAVFNGPYGEPLVSYARSAAIALQTVVNEPFVQSWRTTGKPDPSYALYRYASKVIGGGVVSGCALYAAQTPRPADADDALATARRAADFLIALSAAPGTPLEFFPPTYHDAKPTERENDAWTMLMSPAEAGQSYLDLYDVTHDRTYLDAAARIAGTYGKLQLESGTWPLKVDNQTGRPIAEVELIPSEVIRFFDRLITRHELKEHQPTLDRAVRWMLDNPARTFNWQAQFDDAKVRGPYQNLAKHEACAFSAYLFSHRQNLDLAEEILRFAEDQFVVWEHPPQLPLRRGAGPLDPRHWMTPCSTEQYAMFEPISGSSAFMITAYVRAYQATRKPLDLAKAQSLANALTLAQQKHNGRYPTRMIDQDLAYWLNSTVNAARAMQLLAVVEREAATRPAATAPAAPASPAREPQTR
jgi:maltose/maltodextrin transport system substrate-binding protein